MVFQSEVQAGVSTVLVDPLKNISASEDVRIVENTVVVVNEGGTVSVTTEIDSVSYLCAEQLDKVTRGIL